MWRHWRIAARSLRQAPGFAATCVLTLAVGVGATTALFSVVYGILLRPLPYGDADSLVRLTAERSVAGRVFGTSFSAAEFPEWSARMQRFTNVAAVAGTAFAQFDDRGTTNVAGAYVSSEFFRVVSQPMLVGRPIGAGDAHAPVAVISRRIWLERFHQQPDVAGRSLVLDGEPYTVVGVVGDEFQIPFGECDVWVPLGRGQDRGVSWLLDPANGGVTMFARLRPGVTIAQARDDVQSVAGAVAKLYPRIAKDRRVSVERLSDWLTDDVRPTLRVLAAAVALVLLLTCANLANLQLARQVARQRQTAIHRALGASRTRIAVQTLSESSLVAGVGAVAALAVAWSGVRVLLWMRPANVPRLDAIRLDLPVLFFTLAASALVTLVMALVPLARTSGGGPAELLQRTASTHTASAGARRFRSIVVSAELAAAMVLLVGALLLAASFRRLSSTDLGFRPEQVMTAFVDLAAGQSTAAHAGPRETSRVADILERLSTDPRIESAGAGTSLPPSIARLSLTFKWGDREPGGDADTRLDAAPISPALFRTLGIALLAGRDFSSADDAQSLPVAILSRGAALNLFGNREAVGQQLPIPVLVPDKRAAGVTIVGVVADVHYGGVDAPAAPALYVPFAQYPFRVVHLFARARGTPEGAAPAIREAINAVDRRVAVVATQTLDQSVANAIAQPRFRTVVFGALSIIAVALAAVGLAGLIAYSVSQRTTEIGIRMALGASSADVLRMIVGEASILSLAGIGIGAVAAFASARVLRSLLYQVGPDDPAAFATAVLALLAVAVASAYVPARRVTRIDPATALKAE